MNIYIKYLFFFFMNSDTTEIYTLSLHDALPISSRPRTRARLHRTPPQPGRRRSALRQTVPREQSRGTVRSEEHTSELQSPDQLVCRLLLEKKNIENIMIILNI